MKKIICTCFLASIGCLFGQKDTNQHTFAQTYIGASSNFLLGGSTEYIDSFGNLRRVDLPTTWQPKLYIGGLHFWKRVDFYIGFSLPNVKWGNADGVEHRYSAGVETGVRYYPFKVKHGTISPYIGMNWTNFYYSQKAPGCERGTRINRNALNLETGIAYRNRGLILEFNFQYMATNTFNYPTSRNSFGVLQFSPISVGFSVKYALDFTKSSSLPATKEFNASLDSALIKKKWHNVFHIGIGPSGAFGMGKTGYNSKLRPFLADPLPVAVCPDFGIGYYFDKPALDITLSVRPMFFNQTGYGFEQNLDRISVALEINRFLFNYKGFVPYAGAFVSYEYLHLTEKDHGSIVTNQEAHLPGWGFTIGWDIRPNKSDWWVLRTNARFLPYVKMNVNNESYVISQWEFNFIQFVIYPQRLIMIKQLQKQNKN